MSNLTFVEDEHQELIGIRYGAKAEDFAEIARISHEVRCWRI
jgi:hypothetical protein